MRAFHKISVDFPKAYFKLKSNSQLLTILAIVAKNELPHYYVFNHTSKAHSYVPIDEVGEYSAAIIPMFKKPVPQQGHGPKGA